MKKARTYLLLAYAGSVLTTVFFIVVLNTITYGGEAEGGTGITESIAYLMVLMGLSGIFFSGKYLAKKFESEQGAVKNSIAAIIVLPAVFMACIQLYAAFLFFAAI
jgi:hypothetical protein